MERLTSPFRLQKRWAKPKYNSDQQSALVVLHEYLKVRQQSKQSCRTPDCTPPSGYSSSTRTLHPVESLKRLLPRKRSRAVTRSPILTNGILIRNKQGELLHPPTPTAPRKLATITKPHKLERKMTSMSSQIPHSPCTLKTVTGVRRWDVSTTERQDDAPIKEAKNLTVELSSSDYSKDPDTFYVKDTLKDLTATPLKKPPCSPFATSTQVGSLSPSPARSEKVMCHVSMISKASELTMREQPSALCNSPGAGVLHSTLNYPLHSTMIPDSLPHPISSDSEYDSSTMSFDVDPTASFAPSLRPAKPSKGNCDVCHTLRRQVGQPQLHHHLNSANPIQPRLPQAITESDLLHDRTLVNDSLNVTRGSEIDLSDVTLVNASMNATCGTPRMGVKVGGGKKRTFEESLLSADFLQRLGSNNNNKTGDSSCCPDCSHYSKRSRHSVVQSSTSSSDSSKPSTSSSSLNLSRGRKKELGKRLKQFNKSINSNQRHLEITTLGVF